MSLHESSELSPMQDRFDPEVPQDIPLSILRSNLFSEEPLLNTTSFTESISVLSAHTFQPTPVAGPSTTFPTSNTFLSVPLQRVSY
jgi:hypothetical protein